MIITYLQQFKARLLERKILIEMFLETSLPIIDLSKEQLATLRTSGAVAITTDLSPGDFGKADDLFVFLGEDDKIYDCKSTGTSPFDLYDKFVLSKGLIENHNGAPIRTDIATFMVNYIVLAEPFGSSIPYWNKLWDIKAIEKQISSKLMSGELVVKQHRRYIDNGYFLGHFGELCVPTITKRSFTTDPKVPAKLQELLEKYKDNLTDPIIMAKIEAELTAMDKAWLEGDESTGYLDAIGAKAYKMHRKKMYLTGGAIEQFKDGVSTYEFMPSPLSKGWKKEDFSKICNELRKGNYSRGKETAKGGGMTKTIMRIFQDVKLSADDCKTKRGLSTHIVQGKYIGRHLTDGRIITEKNENQFIGKTVKLRSPQYCATKDGICKVCTGDVLIRLGIHSPGILPVGITNTFMQLEMKSMHGSQVNTKKVNLEDYLI